MGFIIELVLWLIIEVVFWGILFWTGYFVTRIISIGKWRPGHVGSDKQKRKEAKFIATAVIGALFWFVLGIAFIISMKGP